MSTLLLAVIATAIAGARLDVTDGFYALLALIVALLVAAITVAWVRGKRQLAELTRLGLQDDYPVSKEQAEADAIAAGVEYVLLRDGDGSRPVRSPEAIRAEREACHRCRIGSPPWKCTCKRDCYEADCQGGYVRGAQR